MLNVLALRGPPFLALYALLAAATCGAVWLSIRGRESRQDTGLQRLRDPYEIAYLRGGIGELVKVVTVSLLGRGLLEPAGASLRAVAAAGDGSPGIERAILSACRRVVEARELAATGTVEAAARNYHRGLVDKGLMPDAAMMRARLARTGIAGILLGGFALLKIGRALATGHTNIEALIGLVAVTAFALFKIATATRTAEGDRVLGHLGTLFSRVKRGPRPAQADRLPEALLLAAVYGDYSQSGPARAVWRRLFPDPKRGGRSDGGGSCGGGCGSGCGGGGGCGGCGS